MKKGIRTRKLSRTKDQRKALKKSLASSLFLHESIKTTEAKAKEIRPFVEKCITRAKKGNLVNQRHLAQFLSQKIVKKLMDILGKRYKDRPGGYVRIVKLGPRKSDGAKMAIIELVK